MITTTRTILRPYTPADVAQIAPILGDPTTMAFWPQPLDLAAAASWVERSITAYATHGLGRWLICTRTTGAVIGDCGVLPITLEGATEWDLGYIVHYPFWRQGYALECAQAYIAAVRQAGQIPTLIANMPADHIASWRTAEALGFQYERSFANPRNRNILTRIYRLVLIERPAVSL